MEINADKEERGPVGMHVSNKPSEVYITTDVRYGGKGGEYVGSIVYGEEKACKDLGNKTEA